MLLTLLNQQQASQGEQHNLEGNSNSVFTQNSFCQVVANPRFTYTTLSPSVDSRTIYCSYTDGLDSNDGLTISTPKKTQSGAYSLLRDGYPDWIYFKAGDVWSGDKWNGSNLWTKSGRSDNEKMVLTSYGTGPRPKFLTTTNSYWSINGTSSTPAQGNLAFIGLHLHANTYTGHPSHDPNAFGSVHPTENLLIEDCYIDSYQVGISIGGSGGLKQNIKIRGNVIIDCFSVAGTVGHGIYIANTSGLIIEGNVLDHNGWNEEIPLADPSVFRHGIYLQQDGSNSGHLIKNNIIARSASHGIQMRNGGTIYNNLFTFNSIGFLLGGGDAGKSGGVEVDAYGNVIMHGKNLDGSNARGWGITAENISVGRVSGNIIANRISGTFPISFEASSSTYPVYDLEFDNNIIYNWGQGPEFDGPSTSYTSVKIRNNQISDTGNYLLEIGTASLTGKITSSNNRFNSATIPSGQIIEIAAVDYTIDQYKTRVNDTTSYTGADTFLDPERTIASYDAYIGRAGTFDSFISGARQQSRANFNPAFTAAAANSYFRDGFNLDDPAFEVKLNNTTNSIFTTSSRLNLDKYLNGSSSSLHTTSSYLNISKYLNGFSSSLFTSNSVLDVIENGGLDILLTGNGFSVHTLYGNISVSKYLSASSYSVHTTTSNLKLFKYLNGNSLSQFTTSSVITLTKPLVGTSQSQFSSSSYVNISKYLTSSINSQFSGNYDVHKDVYFNANCQSVFTTTANSLINKLLFTSVNSQFSTTNNINLSKYLNGISNSIFTGSLRLVGGSELSGNIISSFTTASNLSLFKYLGLGTLSSFNANSNLDIVKYLTSSTNSIFTTASNISKTINCISNVSSQFNSNTVAFVYKYLNGISYSSFDPTGELFGTANHHLTTDCLVVFLTSAFLSVGKYLAGSAVSEFIIDPRLHIGKTINVNINSSFNTDLNIQLVKNLFNSTNSVFSNNSDISISKYLIGNASSDINVFGDIHKAISMYGFSISAFELYSNLSLIKSLLGSSSSTFSSLSSIDKVVYLNGLLNSNTSISGSLQFISNLLGSNSSLFNLVASLNLIKYLSGSSTSTTNGYLLIEDYFPFNGSIEEWAINNNTYFTNVSNLIIEVLDNNLENELNLLLKLFKDPQLYYLISLNSTFIKQYNTRLEKMTKDMEYIRKSLVAVKGSAREHSSRLVLLET